ncbi:GNAT family N-acetyltransferase (plasmid) [Streptomyces sp. NBC_00536]|uniref:GNAT family N-acetyltransferase n=1 Tax=Streptomyces sp. NBC_00536 TaxID=2975769 RepID=UPI002E80E3E3|nr:GNAT family N-acetyltransferase [Streptomyces sp. NBC_00536]WUC84504.1 GNAT family N-acetyltransferase [Streptomyces sp. NBC_00536]
MILVRAEEADLARLLKFRSDASAWLATLGTDQWAKPFPASHILSSIRRGQVYLAKDHPEKDAAATITLDRDADESLWTPDEVTQGAFYVHKLAVDRAHAGTGLGTRLLDWAGDEAARQGARWLRLDAWTTNTRLQEYYRAQGFTHVRTSRDPQVVSGWAAQRPSRHADHGFNTSRLRAVDTPIPEA